MSMTTELPSTSGTPEAIAITGVTEATILDYFKNMNAGDFAAVASLFAEAGELNPPFEDPIRGPEAIATYLQSEAIGMKLQPQVGTMEFLEDGAWRVEVKGRVQTALFGVNVGWQFRLNPQKQITSATITLLASLEELLPYRR